MREAVIVAGVRTAVGRPTRARFGNTRPEELGAVVVRELMRRVPQAGAGGSGRRDHGMCHAGRGTGDEHGPDRRPVAPACPRRCRAMTVNRFCSSGLQTIAMAAQQIMCGFADVIDRRRRGEHEHGADDRQQALARSVPGGALSADLHVAWGTRPRKWPDGSASPARSGRICRAQPPAGPQGHPGREVQGRDRSGHRQGAVIDERQAAGEGVRLRHRRRGPAGHLAGGAGQAEARSSGWTEPSPRATPRRRATAPPPCGDVGGEGRAAGPQTHRHLSLLCRRRRRSRHHGHRPGGGHSQGAEAGGNDAGSEWICSK